MAEGCWWEVGGWRLWDGGLGGLTGTSLGQVCTSFTVDRSPCIYMHFRNRNHTLSHF